MFGLGAPELLMIFLVVLLLFGGAKLPELARGLGRAIRTFREESEGVKREFEKAMESPPPAESKDSTTKSEAQEQPTVSSKQG